MSTESKTLPAKTGENRPAPVGPPKNARELMKSPAFRSEVANAMPRGVMSQERFLRVALTALNKVPDLMECTVSSLAACLLDCAQLGLEPGGPLGRAYLIPFRNRKKGITECTLIIGYKGLLDLAFRSGKVKSLRAEVVHEKDEFEYEYGLDERLTHRPYLDGDPGKWTHVYAVAQLEGGAKQWTVMSYRQVMAIKARARTKEGGPWDTDEEEMAKKTAFRRLGKTLPLSPEFHEALDREDRSHIEAGAYTAAFEVVGDRSATTTPDGDGGPGPDGYELTPERERMLSSIVDLCEVAKIQRPSAKWTALINGAADRAGVALRVEKGVTPLLDDLPDAVLTEIVRELEVEAK